MTYQEQIKKAVQKLYDETKRLATSRHYTFTYFWVKVEFGLDLEDKKVRDDVWEMSYSNDFCDLIQTVDFDDDKREVTIMLWASNNKKKYTINQYKEFCNDALTLPPLDDFYDGNINEEEWYRTHKIHIMVDNHDMELDYYADNVTEIYSALKEMYEMEMEVKGIDGKENTPTVNNTVGSEYRPAELKDIIRIAVQSDWDHFGYKLDSFAEFIQDFIKKEWNVEKVMWYYNIIHKDIKAYNHLCKCNFNKVDMSKVCDVSSELIKKTIDELIFTDREVLHGITDDNKNSDITFVMDYTLKLSGELIGWFYGEAEDEYMDDLIYDYKRKLFGEEN